MSHRNETPAGKAGARDELLAGVSRDNPTRNAVLAQFPDHRAAALVLLNGGFKLARNCGGFLGQLAVDPKPLSEKQEAWLTRLLTKHVGREAVQ